MWHSLEKTMDCNFERLLRILRFLQIQYKVTVSTVLPWKGGTDSVVILPILLILHISSVALFKVSAPFFFMERRVFVYLEGFQILKTSFQEVQKILSLKSSEGRCSAFENRCLNIRCCKRT